MLSFLPNGYLTTYHIFFNISLRVCAHTMACMWRAGDNLQELSFQHVGSGVRQASVPLNHLSSFIFPYFSYFLNRKKPQMKLCLFMSTLLFQNELSTENKDFFLNKADISSSFKRHLNAHKGISVNISTAICYKMKALNPG